MSIDTQPSPRDYLAVERTFLAWLRTGVALMGLGFVLARFGLFLQEFNVALPAAAIPSYGLSLWFGTALIFLGVVVCVLSLLRYVRMMKQLKSGDEDISRPSKLGIVTAVVLAVLGLAMSAYLIFAHPKMLANHLSEGIRGRIMSTSGNGIVRLESHHSVDETVARLQRILQEKGVKLFAVVDHSGEAEKAGLKMPNTKLVIFGNPKSGTPLMLAAPGVAIDLPLKILVAEDGAGKTWISYNEPIYLQTRHGFPSDLLPNIAVIQGLAAKASE